MKKTFLFFLASIALVCVVPLSGSAACTTPVTVVSDDTPNDAADMQANHYIISTSVCTTSADPDKAYFTSTLQALSSPLTPVRFYYTCFTIDGAPEAAGSVLGVRMVMDSTGTVPTF